MWQVDETQYNKLDPLAEHNSSCRITDVEVFSLKNGAKDNFFLFKFDCKFFLNLGNDTKTSGRKKKGDPEKWAQNIRVKSREKGLSYINRAGKLVPQKSKKEPCYIKCRRRCTSIFSEEERDVIFQKFWNLSNIEKKFFFAEFITKKEKNINRKTVMPSRRTYTFQYYFERNNEKYQVCRTFFLNTINVSETSIYYFFDNMYNSDKVLNKIKKSVK